MIRRRQVFHIAGYDPVSPQAHYARFLRQLKIFERTWNVQASTSAIQGTALAPHWTVTCSGRDWTANAKYDLLAWNDLIDKDARSSRVVRLARATTTYFNLIFTGTLLRYLQANARYFAFALVPLLQLGVMIILAGLAAGAFVWVWGNSVLGFTFGALCGAVVFFAALEVLGPRWRTHQALDDWILSLDYVYQRRPELEARLDQFARRIASSAQEGESQEIVIIGHSLGAIFAIDAVARALVLDPDLGKHGVAVSVLTVGATIPKCGLHPAAQRLRAQIGKILDEPSIQWTEYQSRADPISFYRFNPATMTRIRAREDELEGNPVIRRLHFKNMLRSETYNKFKFRALRLHYQFVSANDRRASYDYYMMMCGPIAVSAWTRSPGGLLDFFKAPEDAAVVESDPTS